MHLEPRDAERHRDIRDRVRLREQILDLPAGFDPPLRHAELLHLFHDAVRPRLALVNSALTHGLHEFERALRLHAHVDEIEHDVVSAADAFVGRRDAVDDDVVDVAGPHVRAVGEARQTDERGKLVRLRVHEHLARERRTELRHADRTGMADDRVAVRDAERLGRGEDAHGLRIVERDLAGVDAGGVLEHTDHRRVIVAELVEL